MKICWSLFIERNVELDHHDSAIDSNVEKMVAVRIRFSGFQNATETQLSVWTFWHQLSFSKNRFKVSSKTEFDISNRLWTGVSE